MKRSVLILAMAILVISAYGLFQIKHRVQNLKRDLVEIHRQLAKDREAIHVLKAEWAYLSQPSRIKQLADEHLVLSYTNASQIKDIAYLGETRAVHHTARLYRAVTPTLRPILSSAAGY